MSELMDPAIIEPGDINGDDDLTTLLQRREHARPNRLTWVLLTVLTLGAGFIGGAYASDRWGTSIGSAGGAAFAGLPAGMPNGFPGAAAAPATATTAGAVAAGTTTGAAIAGTTTGTIKLVDGRKLYLTDASGATVIVTVPKSASVTASSDVALADLSAGATVVVVGETGSDGTLTATSVAQGSTTATQGDN